ncbi:hypothetical protein L7F22_033906 [Adiantum nelumboides]|nr:hypothetical protein [Adiantum nelumboides]
MRSSILLFTAILGIVLVVSSVCVLVSEEVISSVWDKLGSSAASVLNAQTSLSRQISGDSGDDPTCLSRSQQYLYRNPAYIKSIPDPLLKAWASYTRMHRSCAHHNWSTLFLSRDRSSMDGCKFLVYMEGGEGLGNGLLSLTSAFTFAMATGRTFLIDSRKNIAKLLCEPFPESSWVLPPDFPYAELLDCPSLGPFTHNTTNASCVNLNLQHNILHKDQQLFCEKTYTSLMNVKWVAWTSNQYFLTNLFLVPSFWQSVHPMFQENVGHIFTFLARLLLLPANDTWAIILREFWSYLDGANAQLGVQVRLHGRPNLSAFDLKANERIMECLLQNNLLPRFSERENLTELSFLHDKKMRERKKHIDIVVLLASLQGKYAEIMKDQFAKHPTNGSKIVRVHSVSQLGSQDKGFQQAQLAFVEMWLLSYSDNLATSKYSTFGYIAQGLGDIHPYILDLGKGEHISPCMLGQSVEPCTHYPKLPKCLNVNANLSINHKQWIRTYFRHCQDHVQGWQLVPRGAAQGNTVSLDFL